MTESVRLGVSKILGADPDPAIAPNIWQELVKLRIALLSLADAVDARNAAILEELQSEYQTTGLLTHKMHLGLLTTLKVKAGEAFGVNPTLCWIRGEGRSFGVELVAYKAYADCADAISVQSSVDIPVGTQMEVVLRGLYLNVIPTVQIRDSNVPVHSRLATVTISDDQYTSYHFRGAPTWNEYSFRKDQYGYYDIAGFHFTGHIIGSMVSESDGTAGVLFSSKAQNALVYFNPRRV